MADFRKFKTPFFDIEISDPTGNRNVKLPQHILRLVEKVEVLETLQASQANTLTVDIVEGSREPAAISPELGTSGLYKNDNSIAGSITNRTGAVSDLRFSGNAGITFFNEEERELGKVDNSLQTNINGKQVRRTHPGEEGSAPIFLFQERNRIKVTWGYLEDRANARSAIGHIIMINTKYPERGQVKTTITASSLEPFLDQLAPTKGVNLGTVVQSSSTSVITFEDQTTETLLRDICDRLGIDCIISEDLPANKTERDKTKLIVAGQSFKQFLDELARRHNSYWRLVPNPSTGKNTLIFIKKQDVESKVIINDLSLFTYRSPGNIIKSLEIRADFGGLGPSSQVGTDEAGNLKGDTVDASDEVVLFESSEGGKTEELINLDPTRDIPVCRDITDDLFQGDYASNVETTPNESDAGVDRDVANSETNLNSRVITLSMTTMGFTQIIPGTIEVRGLGARYSGKYRILSATHKISPRGYFTEVEATSFVVERGGFKSPDPELGIEPDEQQVDVQLFTPRREGENEPDSSRGSSIFRQFKKFFTGSDN